MDPRGGDPMTSKATRARIETPQTRLIRRNYGRGHGYRLDGQKVAGVTTAIDVLSKPALVDWAARTAAERAVNDWDALSALPITERLEQWSESVLQLGQGTLYPALYRLERQGLIKSDWRTTANNRQARYYALTPRGRRHLEDVLAQWRRVSRAITARVIAAPRA